MTKHSQFFTTLITGFVAQSLGPIPFGSGDTPYIVASNLPHDFWSSRGAYTFSFEEINNGL